MSTTQEQMKKEIIKNALYRFDESTRMVKISLEKLSEEDIWKKPNRSSNSIGNLILHLCGNITQYVISSLGNSKDIRLRDQEFSATSGYTKNQLLEKLEAVVEQAKNIISTISEEEFLRNREVQGFTYSGIGIIIHVVEHYSYHTGQIAFWTKLLKDKDLGFYGGIDLNAKNK